MSFELNVCTLNRDVSVGCLYNYNNAAILPEFIKITSENIGHSSFSPPKITCETTTSDDSEKIKLFSLGIDQHLNRLLHSQKLEINRLWFYDYLKDEAFNSSNNNEVQVTVSLTFIRRTESLKDDYINSNIWNYCDNSHGGTHLVTEVKYGAEFVLWMRKPLDSSKETKRSVEKTMKIAMNNYIESFFDGISSPPTLNKMLETMICSFQGSIGNGCVSSGTFEQCLRQIQEMTNMEKNDRENIWRPVFMQLRRIPTQVEIQVAIDSYEEIVDGIKENHEWVTQQCQHLIESPSLHHVPFLKKPLIVVQELLEPIASACNKVIDDLQGKHYSAKQFDSITEEYSFLPSSARSWLIEYREDVEKVAFLLEGNNLQALDLRSIEEPIKDVGDVKRTNVFVMHFRCGTIDIDKAFKWWTLEPKKDVIVFGPEISDRPNNVTWENIYKEWQGFLNEANHPLDNDVDYAVGILSPSSPYKEGKVVTIGNEELLRAVNRTRKWGYFPDILRSASEGGQKRFRQDSGDVNCASNF